MNKAILLIAALVLFGCTPSTQAQVLSHDEELKCLAHMYVRNLFGDEKQKRPTEGGWSVPTPGEAVTPFEPDEYIPKLKRIQAAAETGNVHAHYLLGEMYASGMCGLPRDGDLAEEHFDKGRAYWIFAQGLPMMGAEAGKPKDGIKEAYAWLKIGLLRYPYVSEKDARRYFADRGNAEPADWEIHDFISHLQPSKEELEKQLRDLLDMAQKIRDPLTQDELIDLNHRAQDWVEKHPLM